MKTKWHVSDAECCNEVVDDMGRTIAVVEEWDNENREHVTLLAAAPDMLSALWEALNTMENMLVDFCCLPGEDIEANNTIAVIQAAIAKATRV